MENFYVNNWLLGDVVVTLALIPLTLNIHVLLSWPPDYSLKKQLLRLAAFIAAACIGFALVALLLQREGTLLWVGYIYLLFVLPQLPLYWLLFRFSKANNIEPDALYAYKIKAYTFLFLVGAAMITLLVGNNSSCPVTAGVDFCTLTLSEGLLPLYLVALALAWLFTIGLSAATYLRKTTLPFLMKKGATS